MADYFVSRRCLRSVLQKNTKPRGWVCFHPQVNIGGGTYWYCSRQLSVLPNGQSFYHSLFPIKLLTLTQWSLYVPYSGHYMYRQFNIQQFYILPTQCIYVFCVDLKTNSDYFPIQH